MALLQVALVLLAAQSAAAQRLYQRPASFESDCLPSTTTATTFSSIFPSDFFLSGDKTSTNGGTTTVTVAQNFAVKYYPAYKEVTNTLTNETYILYQCGGTPPSGSATQGARLFQIPLTSLTLPDTVPYAFLDILNVTDRVQSVSSFSVAPCAQKEVSCNRTAVDPSQLGNATVLGAEVLPLVDGIAGTTPLAEPAPANVPIFTFSASQDPGTLNRAEWIKFMGLFFNKEKEASDYFDSVTAQYNALKSKGAAMTDKPVVAWISHFVFDPDEYYQISFSPYKAQYTEDAGGMMLDQAAVAMVEGVTVDQFSNTTLDFAWNGTQKGFDTQAAARRAFLGVLAGVDVLIDETYSFDPTSYNETAFLAEYGISANAARSLPALNGTSNKVFREDGLVSATGGLDWFEGAIARPADVLEDLYGALTSSDPSAREFTWFRQVEQAPTVVTDAQCTTQPTCTDVKPTPICPLVKECPDGTIVNLLSTSGCEYASCSGDGDATSSSTPTAAPTSGAAAAAAFAPLAFAGAAAAALLLAC
mmetsp:Transcript_1782/g.5178  ORF Transcript_1782/g.5178 Transcript_1782/m.5178 type:complete len:532 (+) Transcript_1782:252-1847(+)